MEKLSKSLVPNKVVYCVFAALYAAACFGFDKTVLWALVALGYLVLAAI